MGGEGLFYLLDCSYKLIDYCGNNCITFAIKVFDKILSCTCSVCYPSTFFESIRNLFVQISTICHNDDLRISNGGYICDSLSEHNHCKRLTTSLGMPDNPTISFSTTHTRDSLYSFLDGKILLISRNFFDIVVIHNKSENQIQKSLRSTEID